MTRQEAETAFAAHVTTLAASLNELDYYALLNLSRDASGDEVKRAYHKAAGIYHPDGHRQADPRVRECLNTVFKRMSEAYRTLSDFRRRKEYDQALGQGKTRAEQAKREQAGPRAPDAALKTQAGKKLFRQALEQIKRKDYKGAKTNLQLALGHEGPACGAIKEKQEEVERLLKGGS